MQCMLNLMPATDMKLSFQADIYIVAAMLHQLNCANLQSVLLCHLLSQSCIGRVLDLPESLLCVNSFTSF